MALESASYIDGLVITNPTGSDSISQGDDHIRLIKTVLHYAAILMWTLDGVLHTIRFPRLPPCMYNWTG